MLTYGDAWGRVMSNARTGQKKTALVLMYNESLGRRLLQVNYARAGDTIAGIAHGIVSCRLVSCRVEHYPGLPNFVVWHDDDDGGREHSTEASHRPCLDKTADNGPTERKENHCIHNSPTD